MYMSSFFNLVLPGTVGGDVVRIWHTNKQGIYISKAINSVFIERIATVLGLVLLVVITQPFLIRRIGHIPGEWVFPSLLAVGCLSTGILLCFDKLPMGGLQRYKIVRGVLSLALDLRQILCKISLQHSIVVSFFIRAGGFLTDYLCIGRGLGYQDNAC